ncbi:hypothetical protein RRG08_033435 [Elysia crispata]|uniref:Uncharacterized protein n=1 Tax=Elysia crispata TaxID=231223 RepID=A0AAE1E5R7_9GAST|nr:hypothetical protein RRG08_033435 [Elysia crispata]
MQSWTNRLPLLGASSLQENNGKVWSEASQLEARAAGAYSMALGTTVNLLCSRYDMLHVPELLSLIKTEHCLVGPGVIASCRTLHTATHSGPMVRTENTWFSGGWVVTLYLSEKKGEKTLSGLSVCGVVTEKSYVTCPAPEHPGREITLLRLTKDEWSNSHHGPQLTHTLRVVSAVGLLVAG